jgi:hypothetical protein
LRFCTKRQELESFDRTAKLVRDEITAIKFENSSARSLGGSYGQPSPPTRSRSAKSGFNPCELHPVWTVWDMGAWGQLDPGDFPRSTDPSWARRCDAAIAHSNAKSASLSRRFGSFACSEMWVLSCANHSNTLAMSLFIISGFVTGTARADGTLPRERGPVSGEFISSRR